MKLYKDVISRSWHFIIKQTQLWPLGLFAVFVVGNGGEIDRYLRYINALVKDGSILNMTFWQQSAWFIFAEKTGRLLLVGDFQTWMFILTLITALVIVVYVVMVAQGGLIYAAGRTDGHSFKEVFAEGQRHTLPLFMLNLSTYLLITIVTLLFVATISSGSSVVTSEMHTVIVLLGVLILIPLVLVISFTARYAANYIVLDNAHLGTAIRSAWKLFFNNILVTVEMALIVFILAMIINLGLLLMTFLMVAPYLAAAVTAASGSVTAHFYTAVFIAAIIFSFGIIIAGSIFSTWQWTAWTLLFKRLQLETHTSKLARIFTKQI